MVTELIKAGITDKQNKKYRKIRTGQLELFLELVRTRLTDNLTVTGTKINVIQTMMNMTAIRI